MAKTEAIQAAIAAHTAWKARLRTAIGSGKFDAPASTVEQDNQCAFGKWLYGSDLAAGEMQTEHFRNVKELHARFHQQAAKVVELATAGQKEAAEKALGLESEYGKVSGQLTQALVRWRATV